MKLLRVHVGTSGRVDWEATRAAALSQREEARGRLREEWTTLSVQEVRALAAQIAQANEALDKADDRR